MLISLIPATSHAASSSQAYAKTLAEAGQQLRDGMKRRQKSITVLYCANSKVSSPASAIYQEAVKHTGVGTEGDYLYFQCNGWSADIGCTISDGKLYYSVSYTVRYYTTAENERATNEKVQSIIRSLPLSGASDYRKVQAIYDYICHHVDYDYSTPDNMQRYSCYGALVKNAAVCQGYSLAFYRLASECGLDTRIIMGRGNNTTHSWNIVRLGGKYYNVDCTWDANKSSYTYFLKGNPFSNHTRDSEYSSASFNADYPMSSSAFSVSNSLNTLPRPTVSISNNADSGKPTLHWAAISGAAKYEIYRATSKTGTYSKMYTTTATSYTNTSAEAGTAYYYKVRTVNSIGEPGVFSDIAAITCDCGRPSVSIKCNSATGKPVLSWSAVSGATKYIIYRSTDGGNTYTLYNSTTATSYTNPSAVPGYSYHYKLVAVSDKSAYADSAESAAVYTVCDCAQPVISLRCNASTGKPTLSWPAIEGAAKYYIYRSTDGGKTYTLYNSTTATSYTNPSAVPGYSYYYKVKAINGRSVYADSAASAAKYIVCDCAQPVLSLTLSNGKPRLSWGAVDYASKYYIYRSTDGKNFSYYTSTTSTDFTNSGATKGVTYYYKVKAICSHSSYGDSVYSAVKSIKATQ